MVIFRKKSCGSANCYCSQPQVPAGRNIAEDVPSCAEWLFPPITVDPSKPDHFMTYHQLIDAENYDAPGYHFTTWNVGACHKCKYVFSSQADKDRHILIIHKGKRAYDKEQAENQQADEPAAPPAPAQHSCQTCLAYFPSRWFLRQHMRSTGHTNRRGRPRVNNL